ncbi:FtsX-like permease family protein [Rubrivivax gelatinosus]|uniref:ABC transporter permease n=1 Tax=Rubrivivax gelatinosus TaxID=28068 RepID=A0ABS1DXW8_RUBGE|nr:ABC transporter permease [Rubrivivax gelatinosus]
MIDLLLAVRNLLRNRRRSFATFIALAIGSAAILLFGGYRKNIEYTMHTAYVRGGGHLQIQHRDLFLYGSGNPTKYSIAGYEAIIDTIRRDPELGAMVTVVTPTLQFGGIASNFAAGVSRTVLGTGVVAVDQNRMREWNEFDLRQTAPPFALAGAPADAALVGQGVARVLMLCEALGVADCPQPSVTEQPAGEALPDDIAALAAGEAPAGPAGSRGGGPRIEVLATSPGGAPNVIALEVMRAELQGFKELDEVYLMMHLPQAQRLIYGREAPKATAITVQLRHSGQIEAARARLEALLKERAPGQPLAVLDFRELNPFFVQTVKMFDTIFGFIFVLIGSIVLFTVGNTMSTAVMERTVEIGTIRAMGLRQRGVQRMFVLEGMILGVAGTVAGAVFALAFSAVLNQLGLTWVPPGSGEKLPLLLLVWGETTTIVGTTLGLILIAAGSAWWPARRASRLVIVDALRHV